MRSLSTGEAAKITRTSVQTVIRWINEGLLKAWKVPGSRFRRIEERELRRFMEKHNIPLHFLDSRVERVLFISNDESHRSLLAPLAFHGRPIICSSPFEAGMCMASSRVAMVVIDDSLGETTMKQIMDTLATKSPDVPAITVAMETLASGAGDGSLPTSRESVTDSLTQRIEGAFHRSS